MTLQSISLQFEGAGLCTRRVFSSGLDAFGNIVRKHFPADISPACLDGHSLLLNSLETRADGPPSLSQIEALRPIRRCATDAAVIGIAIFVCVVWSHGTCGIQTSLCVSADYIWPELRRFSVHPPAYALS